MNIPRLSSPVRRIINCRLPFVVLWLLMIIFSLRRPAAVFSQQQVITFDDLDYSIYLTNEFYSGLFWEIGVPGYAGHLGGWEVPPAPTSHPHSDAHNVINYWGSPLTGIRFPALVTVDGAYFAAQGDPGSWTTGVRIHGYRNGQEVSETDWFTSISTTPSWFAINLQDVDRIVIESIPVTQGGGWYGM